MKKLLLAMLMCGMLVMFCGCGGQNKIVEEKAQILTDAFDSNDIRTINQTIFGMDELEVDRELEDMWADSLETEEGVLEYIFQYVQVKVENVTDTTIEYKIEAPDMGNVFVSLDADAPDISEDELLQYIKDYAKNAETKVETVSLEYILVDEEPIVDYWDEALINALTGGLLDAYQSLYEDMMEEYMEGEK